MDKVFSELYPTPDPTHQTADSEQLRAALVGRHAAASVSYSNGVRYPLIAWGPTSPAGGSYHELGGLIDSSGNLRATGRVFKLVQRQLLRPATKVYPLVCSDSRVDGLCSDVGDGAVEQGSRAAQRGCGGQGGHVGGVSSDGSGALGNAMAGDNYAINSLSNEELIAYRRELVARSRLRGASLREIVAALAAIPFVNPVTNEPFSLHAIHDDIKALETQWQENARQAIEEHKASQLAELREVRRQAWHNNDMGSILAAMRLEMILMGSEAPKVTQVVGKNGGPVQIENVKGYVQVTPDEWNEAES
jgi:hypothetical protein